MIAADRVAALERLHTLWGSLTIFIEDGQQRGPSRCFEQVDSIGQVVRRGEFAEFLLFVLYEVKHIISTSDLKDCERMV